MLISPCLALGLCVALSLSQSAVSPLSVHPSVRPVSGWSLSLPSRLWGHSWVGPKLGQVLWVRCLRASHATFLLLLNLCQNVSDLPLGQLKIKRQPRLKPFQCMHSNMSLNIKRYKEIYSHLLFRYFTNYLQVPLYYVHFVSVSL